ncbi:nSTAND1 domain-containing NTPase [Fulvivirga sediminis]|uniref:Novel STAND NTPase 1 domain-containing protein n=1 Tax=Fulvivirga sediminis TaxID=2803949 RepID=A0A937JZV5_9BACT|nr:hypothetical protein [Fulvivirga sediminis]MBL3655690.1 hypothetical protein [Fulvivirga sediminis]
MLRYDTKIGDHDASSSELGNHMLLGNNPFPGLRAFSIDESHLFFGRERQVNEITVKLSANRFVAVMGYSGSGKSSLMYCGLIPVLHGGFLEETGPNWNVVTTRPGMSPIDNLAHSLLKASSDYNEQTSEERMLNQSLLTSILKSDSHGLIKAVDHIKREDRENTLILVDQFEELFTYRSDEENDVSEQAKVYVNLLLEACHVDDSPIYLAITMRSDYVGKCALFSGLTQMINQSNYLVPQMNREQKRKAIEGPIAVGGGEISGRLLKRLLNEIGDNQDQLPILQHALMRTWDYWVKNHEEEEPLDLRHYNAIGKISQALSQHADEAYDELSPSDREIAEILFKSLTEKTIDNFGRRRSVKLSLVAELAGANDSEVIEVIEKFRQPGRSFLMPGAGVFLTPESIIEISHESLMRIWTRLKVWVEEEHESAMMYRRLSEAAAMYQVGKTGLWRPPDLQLALNWQNKQKPTRAWAQRYDEAFERAIVFLDTSRITYEAEQKNQELLQKRILKRAKVVAVILGVFLLISIFLFLLAFTRNIEAQKQADLAIMSQKEATEQRDIARDKEKEARDQRILALQREQEATEAKIKAERALEDAEEQRNFALKQYLYAQQQTNIAESAKLKADRERINAEEQTIIARENKDRAEKLLYQSIAQSMAVKSLDIEDNNLKGLLAQHAFIFNVEHDGSEHDPYIYNGLYSALAQISGRVYNTIDGKQRNSIKSVVFTSEGDTFYSAGSEGKIVYSSISDPSNSTVVAYNKYPNRVLALSSDDNWLVSGSDSSYIKIYNLRELGKAELLYGHKSFINDIQFIPNSQRFVSAGEDGQLRLNNVVSQVGGLITTTEEPLKVLTINESGTLVAGSTVSGKVILVDLRTGKKGVLIDKEGTPVHAVCFSPDGDQLAIGDEKGIIGIYSVSSGDLQREFVGHKGRVSAIRYNNEGSLLASASLDRTIQIWVTDDFNELPLKMSDNDAYVWDIKFSPDSNYLLAACGDGELRVWPTKLSLMAEKMCSVLERNMTEEEWNTYVGHDIPFQSTCINLLLDSH